MTVGRQGAFTALTVHIAYYPSALRCLCRQEHQSLWPIAWVNREGPVDEGLITDEPRVVLDIGCGTRFLARPLASRVDRLDAIDMSPTMIEEGKRLPGGDNPRLRWMVGRMEEAPLDQPYALVTAGDSLIWMDFDAVLPRLADALTPPGCS